MSRPSRSDIDTPVPVPAKPGSQRIGLLGGSFNPAHDGHRHISLLAIKRLRLDAVWWMVSPQNPLKSTAGMAEFEMRLETARSVARHPRIEVTDIERRLGTRHTGDTLRALVKRFPQLAFVWLMGADNLIEIPKWRDWTVIFHLVPIAVFDRPTYADRALAGKAARRFARYRRDSRRARTLAGSTPPAWVFLRGSTHPGSATSIRELKAGEGARGKGRQRKEKLISSSDAVAGRGSGRISSSDLLAILSGTLEDGQAEDVIVIDLVGKTTIADYMVIATGRSQRQISALAKNIIQNIKTAGLGPPGVEGLPQCDWVLLDAGDVIIHLFRPEVRAFYNLEKMWTVALPDDGSEADAATEDGVVREA